VVNLAAGQIREESWDIIAVHRMAERECDVWWTLKSSKIMRGKNFGPHSVRYSSAACDLAPIVILGNDGLRFDGNDTASRMS
jgi:hypothetical protein